MHWRPNVRATATHGYTHTRAHARTRTRTHTHAHACHAVQHMCLPVLPHAGAVGACSQGGAGTVPCHQVRWPPTHRPSDGCAARLALAHVRARARVVVWHMGVHRECTSSCVPCTLTVLPSPTPHKHPGQRWGVQQPTTWRASTLQSRACWLRWTRWLLARQSLTSPCARGGRASRGGVVCACMHAMHAMQGCQV
jgi:hypothetical protein